MVLAWVVYATLVSLVFTLGGLAGEALLRINARQARGVWIGALVLSLVLPALYLLSGLTGSTHLASLPLAGGPLRRLPEIVAAAAEAGGAGSVLEWLERLLGVGWLASSLCLAGFLVWSGLALRREQSGWWPLDGGSLYRAQNFGPAVVGVLRPRIVLPRWLREMAAPERRLVLLHEEEHARARDPATVLLGWTAVALVPWLFPLWWQRRRLERAVELDCDLRVIRRTGDPRMYGRVLLETGRLARDHALAGAPATVAGWKSFLRVRIESLVRGRPSHPRLRSAGAGLVVAAALAAALIVPPPSLAASGEAVRMTDEAAREFVRPNDTVPRLSNRSEASQLIARFYPERLRESGVSGVVRVLVHVDPAGRVEDVRIQGPSGRRALDRAALEVARRLRFDPATRGGRPTDAWIVQPIRFRP